MAARQFPALLVLLVLLYCCCGCSASASASASAAVASSASVSSCSSLDGPFCPFVNRRRVPLYGRALQQPKLGAAVAYNPQGGAPPYARTKAAKGAAAAAASTSAPPAATRNVYQFDLGDGLVVSVDLAILNPETVTRAELVTGLLEALTRGVAQRASEGSAAAASSPEMQQRLRSAVELLVDNVLLPPLRADGSGAVSGAAGDDEGSGDGDGDGELDGDVKQPQPPAST